MDISYAIADFMRYVPMTPLEPASDDTPPIWVNTMWWYVIGARCVDAIDSELAGELDDVTGTLNGTT